MGTEIKISADLNKALELLSDKIGIASDKILPNYVNNHRIRGLMLLFTNILEISLPWLLFLHNPQIFTDLWLIGKLIICICFTYDGIADMNVAIPKIYTPNSYAIKDLLSDLNSFMPK